MSSVEDEAEEEAMDESAPEAEAMTTSEGGATAAKESTATGDGAEAEGDGGPSLLSTLTFEMVDGKLCVKDNKGNLQPVTAINIPTVKTEVSKTAVTPKFATPTTSSSATGAITSETTHDRRTRAAVPDVYTAPTDAVLPLDHPEPSSYITADEAKELNAWNKVWRDEVQFETLSERDATALVNEGGACHFFGTSQGRA